MSPRLIAAMVETGLFLLAAGAIRLLVVPRFTFVPGRFQMILEGAVELVDGLCAAVVRFGRGTVGLFLRTGTGIRNAVLRLVRGCAALWRTRKRFLTGWACTTAALLVLSFLTGSHGEHGDVKTAMRDAVLHDVNQISLFGWKDVNPALIAAFTVTGILLFTALLIRIFAVPRFRNVPGRFQQALELLVRTLDGLAKSDGKWTFIGAYVFAAGVYIFTGTLFELLGLQAVTTAGASVTLPAPLSDVNAAICMGCLSYLVLLAGGVVHRGSKGVGAALKEFSLPISMSFRLFGALLSGLLVTDLVYHYAALRYVLPVIVGVIFTLLHAVVQSYVLTMLVGMYYAEITETE